MFFISSHTSADLSLTTPPEMCCNCGKRGALEYVETPMKKVRYFFVFGTELTLTEHFPYCADCSKTGARIRQGWFAKLLTICMVTAALFLVFVVSADSLPKLISTNLFTSAVISSLLLTGAYFYFQDWGRKERTYYQPVSLLDAKVEGEQITQYRLKFYNSHYAALVRTANPDLIKMGILKIEVRV
nr:hypothetical protein [Rhodoferax sp.]